MTHTPTQEQQAIISEAVGSTDNLIVSALAGSAKTTTLVMMAEALPKVGMLCLAFNKKVATEMQTRLPSNCTAMTLNSLGHRTWADCITGRVVLKTDKNYKILSELVGKLNGDEKDRGFAEFADTLKMMESGKSAGYIPTDTFPNAKRLMNDDEFFGWLEDEPSALQERLLREATIESIAQGMKGLIDFSDQILLPTVFPSMFPHFPLVMIDEAQDLSALNHATLRKLAKKRLIAVGDENQAIYGFRGAHEDSMAKMKDDFKMRSLVLSISFRCPKAVVAEALWRAPHMKYPEWAKDGSVTSLTAWNKDTVPETAAIICRNNAPLFSMAIKLLKNGRYPQIVGNDIGKYLVKIMKKFGKTDLPRNDVHKAIDDWVAEKLKRPAIRRRCMIRPSAFASLRTPERHSEMRSCMRSTFSHRKAQSN